MMMVLHFRQTKQRPVQSFIGSAFRNFTGLRPSYPKDELNNDGMKLLNYIRM
jgi:hypothetical protein